MPNGLIGRRWWGDESPQKIVLFFFLTGEVEDLPKMALFYRYEDYKQMKVRILMKPDGRMTKYGSNENDTDGSEIGQTHQLIW